MKRRDWLEGAVFGSWWFEEDDLNADKLKFELRAKKLASLGIDAVITFGYHFRWDWIEQLDKVEGMYEKMITACHKYKIKVCEHHSACLVARPKNEVDLKLVRDIYPHHHTGGKIYSDSEHVFFKGQDLSNWYQIDAKLKGPIYTPYYGYVFCPNNPEYQKGYLEMVERLIALGIDALMSDDVEYFSLTSCVCEHCQRKFKKRYGMEIPQWPNDKFWGNYKSQAFRNYLAFRVESIANHYKQLKKIKDAVPLFHCCTTSSCAWVVQKYGVSYVDTGKYCDLVFEEVCRNNPFYYSYLRVGAEAHLNNAIRRYYSLKASLVEPYPSRDEEYFINWVYAKSYNQKIWNCPPPDRPKWEFPRYPMWTKALKFESSHPELFEKGDFYADVCILFPGRSRLIYQGMDDNFVTNEYCGFCETLLENNIMFNTILENEISKRTLLKYKLLILPNAACLSGEEIEAICSFVQKGGKLILSYETGQYNEKGEKREKNRLLELAGISYLQKFGIEKYLNIIDKKGEKIPNKFSPQMLVEPFSHANVVYYFEEREEDPHRGTFPAVVRNKNVIYFAYKPGIMCCAPFYYLPKNFKESIIYEDERIKDQERIILYCLYQLIPEDFSVKVETEKGITVSVMEYKDKYVAHIINRKGSFLPNGSLLNRNFGEKIHYPKLKRHLKIGVRSKIPLKKALLFDPLVGKQREILLQKEGEYVKASISKNSVHRYIILVFQT